MSNIISQTVSTIKNWWVLLISGIALIAGSIYVMQTPQESYVALAWIFSTLVLVNGFSSIYFSISNRAILKGWGWYLVGGIFELLFGLVLIYYPGFTQIILPLFAGFWLLFRGIQMIGTSLDLKEFGILDWGWVMLLGVAITLMASSMVLFPIFAYFNIIYLTALTLFILGIGNIVVAFKLKKIKAQTIDKVDDFKKAVKEDITVLKDEIFKAYDTASIEEKRKVDEAFKAYEETMKS